MAKDIYAQHADHFKNVSAYVITFCGERVATIAFKFPKDGAGRLYCYVHWFGVQLVRGHANGYGYDKKSAAAASAARWIQAEDPDRPCTKDKTAQPRFIAALADDNGWHWDRRLQDAGFTVLQAV